MYPYVSFILLLSSLWLTTPSSRAGESIDTTGNAATVYRQAFELMPEMTREQSEWLHGFRHKNGAELLSDEDQTALLVSLEPALRMAHRAAAVPSCDWSLFGRPKAKGTSVNRLYLRPVRQLALAVLRRGEAKCPDDPNGYVADVLASMSMARHVAQGETLLHFYTEAMLEGKTVQSLARRLPDLPDETLPVLATRWRNLPPAGDFCAAVRRQKKEIPEGFMMKLRAEMKKEEATPEKQAPGNAKNAPESKPPHGKATEMALRFMKELANPHLELEESFTEEEDKEFTAGAHSMAAEVGLSLPAMLLEADADFDRYVEGMCLPPGEHEKWAARFEANRLGLNPVSRMLVPAVHGQRVRCDETRMRSHMLLTAIQVLQEGPEAAKHSVELFGNRPYIYRETANGFELQAQWKEVKLSVGGAPKQQRQNHREKKI